MARRKGPWDFTPTKILLAAQVTINGGDVRNDAMRKPLEAAQKAFIAAAKECGLRPLTYAVTQSVTPTVFARKAGLPLCVEVEQ